MAAGIWAWSQGLFQPPAPESPLAALDPAQIKRGGQIYLEACAQCHGAGLAAGEGQIDLRRADWERGAFFEAVLNGTGAMPAQAGIVTLQDTEDVFWYIRAHADGLVR